MNQQNKIQACIQKLEPEKYWDYAAGFVTDIYNSDSWINLETGIQIRLKGKCGYFILDNTNSILYDTSFEPDSWGTFINDAMDKGISIKLSGLMKKGI